MVEIGLLPTGVYPAIVGDSCPSHSWLKFVFRVSFRSSHGDCRVQLHRQ